MYNILIPDRLCPPADVEQAVFGDEARITVAQATETVQIDDAVWADCDAILAWHDLRFDAAVLDKLARCKVIVRVGVGFDNVDLAEARKRNIDVCTVPDYGVDDVADHAMGLVLSLARALAPCNDLARSGAWDWGYASNLMRLTGATFGIVGLGRIGGAVAHRARAFGMRVLFYDPYQSVGMEKTWRLERCWSLDELAEQSHVISIHTPLTDETRGMIGADFFAKCARQPILINTARGPVVDTTALYNAMHSGLVRCAGLDVLEVEPPDAASPLIKAWKDTAHELNNRLIITPHCSFCNIESLEEMRRKAAEEALRVLRGEKPRSCVNAS